MKSVGTRAPSSATPRAAASTIAPWQKPNYGLTALALLAVAVIVLLTLGTLAAVAMRADTPVTLRVSDWAAIRFTLWQAALSAALSVALAIPVARGLARRRFPGRGLLITALGAPFLLPVIVAAMGLIAIFGRNGVVNAGLGALGLPEVAIYGPQGVILAHVFLNLPLATRLVLQGWLSIPAERFRLAESLGCNSRDIMRLLEWPMLRAVVPGAAVVIFAVCLTSFAVVLALGGGPRATTVELAIYQAFRFDFDLGRAALLGLIQFALTATAAALAFGLVRPVMFGGGLDRVVSRRDADHWALRVQDSLAILSAAVFLLLPMAVIAVDGAPGLFSLPPQVWAALGRSLWVALLSTAMCLALAVPLALFAAKWRHGRAIEALGTLTIAASPLVIGTGLFVVIFPYMRPSDLALPITALVNAALSLPFGLRALAPAARDVQADYGRLAESLGLRGFARLRLLTWPRLRRPIGFAAGLAAALSMGDLGVIALFADPDSATLPLQMYRLMAAYRNDDSAAAALLLLLASFGLFWIFDRGGRADAGT